MVVLALLVASAAGTTQVSQARAIYTLDEIGKIDPNKLADTVLPAGHPPMTRVQIVSATATSPAQVVLYARPERFDRTFCRAQTAWVALAGLEYATDTVTKYRAGSVAGSAVYRVSATADALCEGDTQAYFPITGDAVIGRAVVRVLIAAKAVAASSARLPFAITCVDGGRGQACAGSSNRALVAALRTDAIGGVTVSACTDRRTGKARACGPEILLGTSGAEPAYWVAAIRMRGAAIARIDLTYQRAKG